MAQYETGHVELIFPVTGNKGNQVTETILHSDFTLTWDCTSLLWELQELGVTGDNWK